MLSTVAAAVLAIGAVATPLQTPAPVTVTPAPNCQRFSGDATFDSTGRPFYGTACLQADGRWHIVAD